MGIERRRVPQPAIDRAGRSAESRAAWVGLAVAGIGVLLAVGGLMMSTGLPRAQGGQASERELVDAFRHGGLRFAPPAAEPGELAATMAATSMAQTAPATQAAGAEGTGKAPVVDTSVEEACPT